MSKCLTVTCICGALCVAIAGETALLIDCLTTMLAIAPVVSVDRRY